MNLFYFLQIQDTMVVDTTALSYRIAYTLTSWLPFIIIVIIVFAIIRKRYNIKNK